MQIYKPGREGVTVTVVFKATEELFKAYGQNLENGTDKQANELYTC